LGKKRHCELTKGSQIKTLKLPFKVINNQPNLKLPSELFAGSVKAIIEEMGTKV